MLVAIWIIAICEIIRLLQNAMQLLTIKRHDKMFKDSDEKFEKFLHSEYNQCIERIQAEGERRENE